MCASDSIETLSTEAEALTCEIEAGLLAFASAEARDEWASFRRRWSLDSTPMASASLDESFESIVDRMRRFRAILKARSELETAAAS